MESRAAPENHRQEKATGRLREVLQTLSLVVGPSSLLIALVYFVGNTFITARLRYFGLHPSLLDFSIEDYVIRGLEPLLIPVLLAAILGLLFVRIHETITRWIGLGRQDQRVRIVTRFVAVIGWLLFVVGVEGVVGPLSSHVLSPTSLAFGALAIGYGDYLHRRSMDSREHPGARIRHFSNARVVIFACFGVLGLIGALGDWASLLGRARGQSIDLRLLPRVIVYSQQELNLEGPTVAVSLVGDQEESSYRFRYAGLRLSSREAGNYVLFPECWSPRGVDTVILLPERAEVRVEVAPPNTKPGNDP